MGHLGPLLNARDFPVSCPTIGEQKGIPCTSLGFARYTMVYKLANIRNPPSSLWDKNNLSTSSSRAGSGGDGSRLISSLGMESTGKYLESAPTGLGTSFLCLNLGAFGIGERRSWLGDGEVHDRKCDRGFAPPHGSPNTWARPRATKTIIQDKEGTRMVNGVRLGINVGYTTLY